MDPLTSLVLTVTFAAAFLYALYVVVRRAVASGVDDALARREKSAAAERAGENRSATTAD